MPYVRNCQKRPTICTTLLPFQGLGEMDAVESPPPGVPKDGPRLLVVSSLTNKGDKEEKVVCDNRDDNDNKADSCNPFDDNSFTNSTDWKDDTHWANDFVAGQEEHDRKRTR
jgi:hypothetical protein